MPAPVGARIADGVGNPPLAERSIVPSRTDLSAAAQVLWTQHAMDDTLAEMGRAARRLFPHLRDDAAAQQRLEALCLRAYEATDHNFVAKEAQEWAEGFTVPAEYVAEDEGDLIRLNFDIEALVRERFRRVADDRLNADRVQNVLSPDNPDRQKMLELATVGITVHVDPAFVPNTAPHATGILPPFSKGYLSAPNAVNKCEVELFREPGLALIVHTELLPKILCCAPLVWPHLSKYSWAPKHGKRCGRPVTDSSSAGKGNIPLNTSSVKEASDRQWGVINHPVIRDFALAVLAFVADAKARDPSFVEGGVVQWKMDLKGAFSLLNFRLEDVALMANEMTDGLTIFHLCGQFGWTGTPAAFQVVTRALAWELQHSHIYGISSRCLLYVDDIWGICLRRDLEADLHTCRCLCENLLGKGAIAQPKTIFGRRLAVIGYELDLDTMQMCIMDKNVLKAAYAYLSVDMDRPVPVRDMMRLASYASRYAAICVEIRPLIRALYAAYTGLSLNTAISVALMPADARRSVQIMRLLILLTSVDELHFSRPLASFYKGSPAYTVEFDGCLHGAGIILYRVDDTGGEVLIGGAAIDLSPLDLEENLTKQSLSGRDRQKLKGSNQNLSEFLAGPVLGIRALHKMGLTPCPIRLRGDSVTAITWADNGSFRSDRLLNAATLFVLQCQLLGVTIAETAHLPAEKNTAADYLSRHRDSVPLLAKGVNDVTYRGMKKVDVEESEMLALCDPRSIASSNADFEDLWVRARRAILS